MIIAICLSISFVLLICILWYAERHDKSLKSEQKACNLTIYKIKHEKKN